MTDARYVGGRTWEGWVQNISVGGKSVVHVWKSSQRSCPFFVIQNSVVALIMVKVLLIRRSDGGIRCLVA